MGKPKFRDRVAGAYVEIANRLNTKTPMTLRIADMYLGDLQKYFGKQLYDEKIIFAFAVVTTRDEAPDGDRVVLSKPRDGLLAVLPKGYVVAHDFGMMSTKARGVEYESGLAEPVTVVVKDQEAPGVRMRNPGGAVSDIWALAPKPHWKASTAIVIRDRVVRIINGEDEEFPQS